MKRALPIFAALFAAAVHAGETPAPQPAPQAEEACSICDLRQQSKRRLAEARQTKKDSAETSIIALPPTPKED